MYDLLGVEVTTDKKSVKFKLTQGGFTKKVLNKVGVLDSNKKATPAATIPFGTDVDGNPFDEPC